MTPDPISLTGNPALLLRAFLLGNEQRIAKDEDGLGILACVFREVFGRPAAQWPGVD